MILCKEMHPDWEIREWDMESIQELIKNNHPEFIDTFNSYSQWIKKHDAARYFILLYVGGVVLDHDTVPLKNIEPLLGTCEGAYFYDHFK